MSLTNYFTRWYADTSIQSFVLHGWSEHHLENRHAHSGRQVSADWSEGMVVGVVNAHETLSMYPKDSYTAHLNTPSARMWSIRWELAGSHIVWPSYRYVHSTATCCIMRYCTFILCTHGLIESIAILYHKKAQVSLQYTVYVPPCSHLCYCNYVGHCFSKWSGARGMC